MTDDNDPTPGPSRDGPNRYEWSRFDRPSTGIVEAVAATTGRDVTDLPPLQWCLDAEALDRVVTAEPGGSDVQVSFTYAAVEVTVTSRGSVLTQELDD